MTWEGALYLLTPDGEHHEVPNDVMTATRQAASILLDHDWVEIRRYGVHKGTRWTVLQRSATACPQYIAVEEWSGDWAVHDMKRRE